MSNFRTRLIVSETINLELPVDLGKVVGLVSGDSHKKGKLWALEMGSL
jgi:hypothetical protein